ncbi:glycine betaine ABC transporter substrate-binding protein [Streptomyces sp. NPDC005438]|uniref:glycine betaine ABC transporter substrate-binding protein n=1 Tax=Streptomyces sp. NPDC005438 TaxID=3156880 RepID=UPI0033A305B5
MKGAPRVRRARIAALTAGALALTVALSGCGKADPYYSGSSKTVTLPVASWAGAEANVAVVKQLLEKELGYRVKAMQMDEPVAFDALNSGKAQALLEDWRGVPKKEEKYVKEKKTVTYEGPMGVTGHIGWYVPKYYADKHPEVRTWQGLKKRYKDFRTPESGDKGQMLEGSPSYVTYDAAIIKNLGMNFKTVYAGSEAAQIKEMQKNYAARKPFVTYWWTPQWLNSQLDLVEVKLPPYKKGCDADPDKVKCAYPHTALAKFFNADFARDGGKAAEMLRKFRWTTADQTKVVKWMTIDKMDTDEAAARWVEENKDIWSKWMP